jgi:hypothetical protein
MSAFSKNFTSVSNVSWQKADAFYFANFKMGSEEMEAAYDERGELVGFARKIDVSQLPLGISISLKNKFEDYSFTTPVREVNFEGQTMYFLSGENDKKVVDLKCTSDGQISVQRKIKK